MADDLNLDLVKQLPRWAAVAYAARCAERVLPLYRLPEGHPQLQLHIKRLNAAIEATAHAARVARAAYYASAASADSADSAASAASATSATSAAYYAARAAARAADSTRASRAVNSAESADSVYSAFYAARAAYYAADDVAKYFISDLTIIHALAKREGWTDETVVSQEVFGPMWPDGEPEWSIEGREWQEKILKQTEEVTNPPTFRQNDITLLIDPSVTSSTEVVQFLSCLNQIYKSLGGDELVIRESGTMTMPVLEEVTQ